MSLALVSRSREVTCLKVRSHFREGFGSGSFLVELRSSLSLFCHNNVITSDCNFFFKVFKEDRIERHTISHAGCKISSVTTSVDFSSDRETKMIEK